MKKLLELVKIKQKAGDLTAYLTAELDHHNSKIIRERIDEALFLGDIQALTLDFSGVKFMDSSGIGLILGRLAKCRELGIKMSVTNLSLTLYRIVALSGIEKQKDLKIDVRRGEE